MMSASRLVSFVLVGASLSTPVFSATVFSDRASFDAVTVTALDTFESGFPAANFPVNVANRPGFKVTEEGPIPGVIRQSVFSGVVSSGSFSLAIDEQPASDFASASITRFFEFATPISAFGLDVATTEASTVRITSPDFSSQLLVLAANTPGFFGIVAPGGITSITFDTITGDPIIGFDDVAYGTVVPLPAAAWLFGSVILGAGLLRKKTNNAA